MLTSPATSICLAFRKSSVRRMPGGIPLACWRKLIASCARRYSKVDDCFRIGWADMWCSAVGLSGSAIRVHTTDRCYGPLGGGGIVRLYLRHSQRFVLFPRTGSANWPRVSQSPQLLLASGPLVRTINAVRSKFRGAFEQTLLSRRLHLGARGGVSSFIYRSASEVESTLPLAADATFSILFVILLAL
ncbi:hypothetical protein SAMN05216338_10228 [Bradyrhizobium sp. Rc2d]|nr:hypothetical protein SAMN05216338_10228 [Bradyrhizobium sp. Rc2d]